MAARSTATLAAASVAAALLLLQPATAQTPAWPTRPVRIVVAGAAGAAADVTARMLADAMTKSLGRPVVVDPRPGAAGTIAINELLTAPHDGHTVLVGVNSLVSEVPHVIKSTVDAAKSITPLAELARGGLVLVSTPALPAATVPALIAYARAHPGQLAYASYSPGTMSHILGLQLNKEAGIDLVHVGYKGSTPALADVMGGHVPLMFDAMPTSLPLVRSGKVRALAISLPRRSPLLPHVPTFSELGYPQLEAIAWIGLWATPDVPSEIRARLRQAALDAMARPQVREKLQQLGFEAGLPRSTDELKTSLQADYRRVGATLKAIGFKPE